MNEFCQKCQHKKPINKKMTDGRYIKAYARRHCCTLNGYLDETTVIEYKTFEVPDNCPFFLEYVLKAQNDVYTPSQSL